MLIIVMNTQQITTPAETSRPCENPYKSLALKCVSCTENEAKDGFILKLVHQSTVETKTAFGKKVTPIKHTFYMKVAEPCVEGTEAVQDMTIFNIIERQFEAVDVDTNEVTTMWLKWLHVA